MLSFFSDPEEIVSLDLVEVRKDQDQLASVATTSCMAANGAACIGCFALSTRSTASAASMRRLTPVDTEEEDLGVCPNPSPSSSTSLGACPFTHVGENGPATRTPFTSGVRRQPYRGTWLLENREIDFRNSPRFSTGHSPFQVRGQPCRFLVTVYRGRRLKRFSTSSINASAISWKISSSLSRLSREGLNKSVLAKWVHC